jgi:D-3-phosphoglycerate dehydrogenase
LHFSAHWRPEQSREPASTCFWNEPNIDGRFKTFDNAVLQPHHASGTTETRRAMGKLVQDNLAAHFSGVALITPVV